VKKYDYIMEYIKLYRKNPLGASRYAPIIKMYNEDKKIVEELLDSNDFDNKNNLLSFLDYGLDAILPNEFDTELLLDYIDYVLTMFKNVTNKWALTGDNWKRLLKEGM